MFSPGDQTEFGPMVILSRQPKQHLSFPTRCDSTFQGPKRWLSMKTAQKQHKTAVPIVKLGFYHQQFMFVVTVRICSEKSECVTWDYCSQLFLESHKFHGSSHHQAVHLVSSQPYLVQTPTASSEKGSPYQVGQQLKTKKAQYPHGCLELPIFRVKSQLSSPCLQFLT
jgi:hypothetical protein